MTRPDVRLEARARLATIDDKDQLFRLSRAFATTRGFTIDDDARMRALELVLSVPAVGRVLTVEERGGLVGYALLAWAFDLRVGGRTTWLTELYVVPEWRGAGRAKAMVELAKTTARDAGAQTLHALATDPDKDAMRLYKSAGAALDPRRIFTLLVQG
jgi:GNAT superfamily N-acetyltransferase